MAPQQQLCIEQGCYSTTTRSRCDSHQREYLKRRRRTVQHPERLSLDLAVLERDKHRCQCCGSGRKAVLSVHHVNGDANDFRLENLITVCGICDLEAHRALRRRRQARKERELLEGFGS